MAQDPRDASGTWCTAGRLVCNGCYKARATRSEIFQKFYPYCTECVVPAHMHCRRSDDILISNAAQVSTRIIGLVPNRAQQQHHERAHQLTISCDAPEPTRDLTRDFRYKPDNIFLMLSRMPHELGRLVGSAEFQGPHQLVFQSLLELQPCCPVAALWCQETGGIPYVETSVKDAVNLELWGRSLTDLASLVGIFNDSVISFA